MIDLHVHTIYCDGKNSPEEMVLSAINKGVKKIGLLAHSYVDFDPVGTISQDRIPLFVAEVNKLKQKYQDKITVLCGIEYDTFSSIDVSVFDYVIGSVHYVSANGKKYAIDAGGEVELVKTCQEAFNGDYYALVDAYFEEVSTVIEKTNADIIGHFDIVSKYNKNGKFFDETSERYLSSAKKTIDKLIPFGRLFEINTGAVSRGYKDFAYPSKLIIDYIKSKGGKFILSSDAHKSENIASNFDDYKKYL